ncbi:hypothetical protein CC2G_009775 [Coprinopsis cinerea AmutBmut pab1-1]|nr:hypothetical protein CC2G_009775 [Coprinopsis cinerea AmutBmut pab1-1]
MPRISPAIMARARNGEATAFTEMFSLINTDSYTPEILEVALSHLRRDVAPSRVSGSRRVDTLISRALGCVSQCLLFCRATPFEDKSVDLLMDDLEAITHWLTVCFLECSESSYNQMQVFMGSNMLYALTSLNERLGTGVFGSPSGLRYLHLLWTSRDHKGQPFSEVHNPIKCSILASMQLCISNPMWRDFFVDFILSSPTILAQFCECLRQRVAQVVQLQRVGGVSASSLCGHTLGLFQLASWLGENSVILKRLQASEYLRYGVEATTELSRLPQVQLKDKVLLLAQVGAFFPLLPGSSPSALAPILPKLLDILARIIPQASKDPFGRHTVSGLALGWRGILGYLRVNKAFKEAMDQIPPRILSSSLKLASPIRDWSNLLQDIQFQHSCMVDFSEDPISLCDNDLHDHDSASPMKTSPKSCSGCHSVVYCTTACQNQDWSTRHRDECAVMNRSYRLRKERNLHRSQHTRAFQVYLAVRMFRRLCEAGWECRMEMDCPGSVGSKSAIARTGFSLTMIKRIFFTFDELRRTASNSELDCPAMEARRDTIIADYRSQTGANIRLLEVIFSWDSITQVVVLAEFRQSSLEPEKWNLHRNVVHIERFKKRPSPDSNECAVWDEYFQQV